MPGDSLQGKKGVTMMHSSHVDQLFRVQTSGLIIRAEVVRYPALECRNTTLINSHQRSIESCVFVSCRCRCRSYSATCMHGLRGGPMTKKNVCPKCSNSKVCFVGQMKLSYLTVSDRQESEQNGKMRCRADRNFLSHTTWLVQMHKCKMKEKEKI